MKIKKQQAELNMQLLNYVQLDKTENKNKLAPKK